MCSPLNSESVADLSRVWPLGLYPDGYMHPLLSAHMVHPALLPLSPTPLNLYYPTLPLPTEQTSPTDLSMSSQKNPIDEKVAIKSEVKEDDLKNSSGKKLKFGIEEILEAGKCHHSKDDEIEEKTEPNLSASLLPPLPQSLSIISHKPYQFSSRNGILQIPLTYPFAIHPHLRTRHFGCPPRHSEFRSSLQGFSELPHSSETQSNNQHDSQKRKRSWSRAVFSALQRKGLEKRFEIQKYVTKPDRRQLAAMLGLTDAQVKVWFQNRRMKWRHVEEQKKKRQNQERRSPTRDTSKLARDTSMDVSDTSAKTHKNTVLPHNTSAIARESTALAHDTSAPDKGLPEQCQSSTVQHASFQPTHP